MKESLKQMENLDKWRKQMSKLGLKDKKQLIKTFEKTLKDHLKKRNDVHTPETRRIQYQLKHLQELVEKL